MLKARYLAHSNGADCSAGRFHQWMSLLCDLHSLHLHKLGQSASGTIDLDGVLTGSTDENGIEHGALIIAFVDAVLNSKSNDLEDIRNEILQQMGAEGLVDTAASIASFNSIVRVANATGTQLDRLVTDQLDDLSGNTAWLEHVPIKN